MLAVTYLSSKLFYKLVIIALSVCVVVAPMASQADSASLNISHINWQHSAGYDYASPSWMGKEKLNVRTYSGVDKVKVDEIVKGVTAAYQFFGDRPIVETYGLFWHGRKSDINKVANDVCILDGAPPNERGCMDWMKSWGTQPVVANAGLSGNSLYATMSSNDGWWQGESAGNMHMKIAAHEYFHVYQGAQVRFFEKEGKFGVSRMQRVEREGVGPLWLEEGAAEYFGFNILGMNGWADYQSNMKRMLNQALNEIRDSKSRGVQLSISSMESLGDLDYITQKLGHRPHLQYEGGAWAIAYLSHLTGSNKAAFVDYYINLAENEREASQGGKPGMGWKKSFKEAFGLSVEAFYQKFDNFMTWSESKQMAILMAPGKM